MDGRDHTRENKAELKKKEKSESLPPGHPSTLPVFVCLFIESLTPLCRFLRMYSQPREASLCLDSCLWSRPSSPARRGRLGRCEVRFVHLSCFSYCCFSSVRIRSRLPAPRVLICHGGLSCSCRFRWIVVGRVVMSPDFSNHL
jgi:hypothetical protein